MCSFVHSAIIVALRFSSDVIEHRSLAVGKGLRTFQPLELHFALLAYDRMSAQRNVQTAELARSIYSKYISLRTASCCFSFIPQKIRQEIGIRLKSTGSGFPDPRLFTSVLPYLDSFLRQQHEQFVCSEEFLEAFNRVGTYPFIDLCRSCVGLLGLFCVLFSSLEKMYPTSSIPRPYVCHATTSQNDSAVSSSFSSDANGHRPTRLVILPFSFNRVEQHSKADAMQFDHNTEEGRRMFAAVLCKKLNRLQARRERNDETERQLRDIEDRKCTTRELVSTSEAAHDVACDDEDDVECYLERMREDSLKASANRSPRHTALSPSEWLITNYGCFYSAMGVMSMSMSSYPRSANQFAPPPLPNTFNTRAKSCWRSANQTAIYDSSGVESMAPSAFSDTSRGSRRMPARRTLPSAGQQLMTISYKGIDGVPVVAHVPVLQGGITLKEFRRHFSISSHSNVQFFFKSTCEDGSAPYQLLLVNDDSAFLPVFEGKITAELKRISPE
ncbi:unnamed protein product [Heligmosomoides polygyrus]|uniref:DIX domain-containing protein n=1 Tax=Heligmosomoides polygyrus TaxID=6339 RepID=A0A183F6Q1_HELPZ|nr:unnamed protein product [Heligmosomoides polygyrus]